jgi:DNA-binding XRE family transcriptional regulator
MAADRPRRPKVERTAEQKAEEEAIREQFRHKPGLRALLESGEISRETYEAARRQLAEGPPSDPTRKLIAALRAERERLGLSLADVAERSGIDRAAIHKLEIGLNKNPTMATLVRYARALGAEITWGIEAASAR